MRDWTLARTPLAVEAAPVTCGEYYSYQMYNTVLTVLLLCLRETDCECCVMRV